MSELARLTYNIYLSEPAKKADEQQEREDIQVSQEIDAGFRRDQ